MSSDLGSYNPSAGSIGLARSSSNSNSNSNSNPTYINHIQGSPVRQPRHPIICGDDDFCRPKQSKAYANSVLALGLLTAGVAGASAIASGLIVYDAVPNPEMHHDLENFLDNKETFGASLAMFGLGGTLTTSGIVSRGYVDKINHGD